ncbi:MAG: hypothetical protein WA919_07040 [Coleofasciculaceae cyanobacterium]
MNYHQFSLYILAGLPLSNLTPNLDKNLDHDFLRKEQEVNKSVLKNQVVVPQSVNSIVPPERLGSIQPLTEMHLTEQKSQSYFHPKSNVLKNTVANTDFFANYLTEIKESLSSEMVMRLPSQLLLSNNSNSDKNKHTIDVVSSTYEPRLTINIFTCKEQIPSCLIGSLSTSDKTVINAQEEFEKHQLASMPITLTEEIRGYFREGARQKPISKFSSLMWQQDNQFYTVRFLAEERHNIIHMAYTMASSEPLYRSQEVDTVSSANLVQSSTSLELQTETEKLTEQIIDQVDLDSQVSENTAQVEYPQFAAEKPSPLQEQPTRLINLETANQLDSGAVKLGLGFRQSTSSERSSGGTGDQVYSGSIDWGVTERLQIGLSGQYFDDPTNREIAGELPNLELFSLAPNFKYQLIKDENLSLGISGAAELLTLSTDPGLFNNSNDNQSESVLIGNLQVPLSYNLDSQLQLHLTPGVAFYPETVNDADFFGTFFHLGTGISWQASERLNLFANASLPLGPGDNAVDSEDGSLFRQVLWTVGGRYALNPQVGVEVYGTNAFGSTPTTSLLAFIPDGNQVLIGANLNYTPDFGQGYASSFRKKPTVPLSRRDIQLLLDGLTLTTASTLPPQSVALRGGLGSGGNASLDLAYGLTNDLQLEFALDDFGGEDNVSSGESAGTDLKYNFGAKLRFLDQVQGDPFSLSFKLTGGRDTGRRRQVGTLFVELPMVYQTGSKLALFVNPKAAFYSDMERVGVGLGVNYAVSDGLQLIGELTPVLNGERSVWSVGARYLHRQSNLGLDIYTSNAIGQNGLGGLVGESGTSIGFNLHWLTGWGRHKP